MVLSIALRYGSVSMEGQVINYSLLQARYKLDKLSHKFSRSRLNWTMTFCRLDYVCGGRYHARISSCDVLLLEGPTETAWRERFWATY
jgi:hypothetical protein